MKKLKKIIICSIVSLILCFVGIFGINADSTQDESNHNFSSNWIAEDFVPNNVIPSNLNGVYEYQINPNFATWFNSLDETVKDTYFPRKHQINYGEQNIKFFGFGSNVLPDDISNPYSLLSLCDVVSPTNEYYLYQSPFMIEENIHDYNSSDYLINKVRFDIVTVNEYGDFEDITLLYYDFNSKEMSYDLNAVALLDYKLVVPSNSNLYEINYFMLGLVNGFNDQIINSLNNSYFLMNQLFIPVNETETKYTVSFDLNGATGTPPSSYQVVAMGNAITPTEPTRNGYVFKGWLKNTPVVIEGVAPEKTIDHLVISSDTIFYALWEAQTRVVTFDYNYDDIGTYKTINVGYGECPTLPLNPIRTGYTFKGWSISSNSSELVDVVNTRIYADRTYYAVWQINQFNVSFDLNGAEGTPPSSYQVDANGNAITPTEPIREGYVFKGWLKNTPVVIEGVAPEKTIEHLVITTDIIFYALWEIEVYEVDFVVLLYNEVFIHNTQFVEYLSSPVTPVVPNPLDYGRDNTDVFNGWCMTHPEKWSEACMNVDDVIITNDTDFIAYWTSLYTINFYLDFYDSGVYNSQDILHGNCAILPTDPTREGYIFKGWTISVGSTEVVDVATRKITNDAPYYAVWEEAKYNVSFDLNGASGVYEIQKIKYGGNPITPTEPVREGYVFKGWLKNTPVVIEGVAPEKTIEHLVITTDTIFYALWEAQTRIVEFDLNGGIGEVPQNQIVSYGGSITTPSVVPTKEGYNFIGWSVYKNWSNESDVLQDLSNEVIYSDRTYYACWSKIPNYEFSYLSEDQIYYYEDLEWQTLDKNIFDLKVYDVNNELINGTCTWEHKIPFNSAQDDDFVLNDYNNIIVTFVPENNNYNSFSFEIEFLVYETKTIVIEFKVKLKVGINQYNEILLKTKEYNREYKLSNDEIKDFINSHMTFDYQIISIENHNTPILTMPKTIIINVTYNTKFVYFLNYGKPYSDYTEEVNMKWETSDFTIDYLENSLLYKPVYLLNPIRNGYIFKGWKNAEGEIVNGGMIESSSPISYYFLYAMWEKEPSNYLDQIDTENVVDKKYPNVSEANYIEIDNLNLLLSYIGDEGKITILPNYKDSFVLAFQKPNGYKKYLIKFDKTFDFLIGKEIIESYYEVENNEILINYYLENNIMLIHNLNNGDYVSNNYITLSSRDFGFIDDDTEKLRSYYIYFNSDIPVDKFLEMEFNLKYHFIVNSLFKDRVTDPIEVNFTYNDVATQVLTKGGWWIFNNYKDYAFTDYLVENVFEEGSYVVNNTVYKYRMLLMHEDYEIDTWKYFVLSPLTLGLFQNYLKTSPDDELVVDYLDPIKCSYILNGTEYKDVQVWDKIDIGTEEDNDGKAEDLTPDVVPETKYGPFSFKGFILDLIELVKNFSWLGLLNLVKNYWGVIGIIIGVPIAAMFFKPLAVVLKLVINIVSLPFKLLKLIFGGRK